MMIGGMWGISIGTMHSIVKYLDSIISPCFYEKNIDALKNAMHFKTQTLMDSYHSLTNNSNLTDEEKKIITSCLFDLEGKRIDYTLLSENLKDLEVQIVSREEMDVLARTDVVAYFSPSEDKIYICDQNNDYITWKHEVYHLMNNYHGEYNGKVYYYSFDLNPDMYIGKSLVEGYNSYLSSDYSYLKEQFFFCLLQEAVPDLENMILSENVEVLVDYLDDIKGSKDDAIGLLETMDKQVTGNLIEDTDAILGYKKAIDYYMAYQWERFVKREASFSMIKIDINEYSKMIKTTYFIKDEWKEELLSYLVNKYNSFVFDCVCYYDLNNNLYLVENIDWDIKKKRKAYNKKSRNV